MSPRKPPVKKSARNEPATRKPKPTGAAARAAAAAERKAALVADLAAALPSNPIKKAEFDPRAATRPPAGPNVPADPLATGSTLSEENASDKTGKPATLGTNPAGPLDRMRVDSSGRALSTNQGVPVGDNQNSLKAGLRGPTLLEDFILREKITHFDHERIPERIVHARGSAAHGFFEAYDDSLARFTRAAPFQQAGKVTPTFVRFSTVAGERGSMDTARDARGFAVKFYTDEGNWDLVGNNIPVFFIQDAMKFPDLVHAVKPEPHHGMPQAAAAHDTFWDFVSLMPESTHMLMWVMSDRAIPRSYRTMQGFGVHTFRLVDARGRATLVKFHWTPLAGTHSLVWDEAVKIAGADPDFHRRDLWESIEAGNFPEYELGVQLFSEDEAEGFPFDVLDATKLVPEELVRVRPVGRMVLNRNPDNFFAETEQVAFCAAHVIPGIDFTNDPLLAGRIHSYVDTQISRLGGPNFHEIPINAPLAQVHNNQRDGMHRQAIPRGRVAYEPNSLGGGCPFQAGAAGFVSFPEPVEQSKLRGKPEKFAEHYAQATLFWESQAPHEKAHVAAAFRFELSKVTVPAIRERMVASLRNVSDELATRVANGLGMRLPRALPRAMPAPASRVETSPALSLLARPGETGVRGLRVALLVAPGADAATLLAVHRELKARGAQPRFVGPRIGPLRAADGSTIEADASFENEAPPLFDAIVLPDGDAAAEALEDDWRAVAFVLETFRHLKPILALGASAPLLEDAGALRTLPSGKRDPGIAVMDDDTPFDQAFAAFLAALETKRHFAREQDPPAF